MKVSTILLSVAIATLVLADGDSTSSVFEVPLIYNPAYRGDFQAQMQKMRYRYGSPETIAAAAKKGVGLVPVTNPSFDTEYYGPVKIGTPGQTFNMDFDTGSADIWLVSSTCPTTACKNHRGFNSSSSTTFTLDPAERRFQIVYGDGSYASGYIGTDMVNVGGIQIRQTIGLATNESAQFGVSKVDGLFGLGFSSLESVPGVETFMTNAIAEKALALPVVSAYLPSLRRSGGKGGHYLFGAIDSTKFQGDLTYVPVTVKGYWQIAVQDILVSGQSLNSSYQGIIDTGTTLVILDNKTAAAVHSKIDGAYFDGGWIVPCSLSKATTGSVGFELAGKVFEVPMADIAWAPVGTATGKPGEEVCYSGVQSMSIPVWILGDVFIKNNYCVFDQSDVPSVGIAPLK
ncbi:Type I transmembrane sorting receptor [Mortierella hygrophila]|uniref:rhizopuspepsin n=1 Tax=Mortierella hygrophila TaxID=979708 RepID=A0A9P6F9C3_9FUNG|nr:Type I transmembrane sorting receptor [Mortierella hygrophila]